MQQPEGKKLSQKKATLKQMNWKKNAVKNEWCDFAHLTLTKDGNIVLCSEISEEKKAFL